MTNFEICNLHWCNHVVSQDSSNFVDWRIKRAEFFYHNFVQINVAWREIVGERVIMYRIEYNISLIRTCKYISFAIHLFRCNMVSKWITDHLYPDPCPCLEKRVFMLIKFTSGYFDINFLNQGYNSSIIKLMICQ